MSKIITKKLFFVFSLFVLFLLHIVLINGRTIKDEYTDCEKNVCTYSSKQRYAKEDNVYKPLEQMKSLKKVFKPIYLSEDKNFNLELLDYNSTWIYFKISTDSKNINKDIPFKIIDIKEESLSVSKQDYQIRLTDTKDAFYTLDMTKNWYMDSGIKWGYDSTTISLKSGGGTELYNDTYIRQAVPNTNYADITTSYTLNPVAANREEILYKFNLSILPVDSQIISADLYPFLSGYTLDAGEGYTVHVHHITSEFNPQTVTWNTIPDFNDTDITTKTVSFGDPIGVRHHYNITPMVRAVRPNTYNLSFGLNVTILAGAPAANDRLSYTSSGNADPDKLPMLNITYSMPSPDICSPDESGVSCTDICSPIFESFGGDGWIFSVDECQDDSFGMVYWYVKNDSDSDCDTYVTGTGNDDCAEVSGMILMGQAWCPSYERNNNVAVAYDDCYCLYDIYNQQCDGDNQATIENTFNFTHPFFVGDGEEPCTPSYANTTKTEWINISCVPSDQMNQSRNWTQYDENNCGYSNETFIEYQLNGTCDYCTPNMTNSSWSAWVNMTDCLVNNSVLQNRSLIQFDSNYCGEVSNYTWWEFNYSACTYTAPPSVNTTEANITGNLILNPITYLPFIILNQTIIIKAPYVLIGTYRRLE